MFFVSDAMAAGEAAAQVGGMEGFLKCRMPWWQRILAISGGLLLIEPALVTDIVLSRSARRNTCRCAKA